MEIIGILLVFVILFILYFIFFKKRIVISENMGNTEFHKNDDYNIIR